MAERHFTLEWDRPFLPEGKTHVSLFDGPKVPINIVASGHGPDDADALFDLWTTLVDRNESAEAIAFVAGEYEAVTGKSPTRSGRGR
jgi:hypothetical protein